MNGSAYLVPTPLIPVQAAYAQTTVQAIGLALFVPIAICAYLLQSRLGRQRRRVPSFSTIDHPEKPPKLEKGNVVAVDDDGIDAKEVITPYIDHFPRLDRLAEESPEADREQMVQDKELYWQLQNLEDHPGTSCTCGSAWIWLMLRRRRERPLASHRSPRQDRLRSTKLPRRLHPVSADIHARRPPTLPGRERASPAGQVPRVPCSP